MTKMNRMSAEEKARYRLDDTLGGSSTVIQQRAIKRLVLFILCPFVILFFSNLPGV